MAKVKRNGPCPWGAGTRQSVAVMATSSSSQRTCSQRTLRGRDLRSRRLQRTRTAVPLSTSSSICPNSTSPYRCRFPSFARPTSTGPSGPSKMTRTMCSTTSWPTWCPSSTTPSIGPRSPGESSHCETRGVFRQSSLRWPCSNSTERPRPFPSPRSPNPSPSWRAISARRPGFCGGQIGTATSPQPTSGLHLLARLISTTNSDLAVLHSALVRPGRNLAVVDFHKFSPDESRRWLGKDGPYPKAR